MAPSDKRHDMSATWNPDERRTKLMNSFSPDEWADRTIAVVVTYNRKELLIECLTALLRQTCRVARIMLIDNASTDGTPELLAQSGLLDDPTIDYVRLPVNSGGSGGFHEGVKRAYATGYEWLWIMDDDVEPYPDSLARMLSYSDISGCIHGAEVFRDGQRLEWEHWTKVTRSGKLSASEIQFHDDWIPVSVGCFEGMLIRRDIVSRIGFPDKRFFIGGDDVAYGYLASRHTQAIYIRKPCFIKKIKPEPFLAAWPARFRNRLWHHRSRRFYFLAVRNELLLQLYLRDAVQPVCFYMRIFMRLLRLSAITLLCERRIDSFCLLWKGAWSGLKTRFLPGREVDLNEIPA